MNFNTLKYFIFACLLLATTQCKVNKNMWITRQYHMLTTQYNVLFHGKEKLKEGESFIKESYSPDYNELLLIFEDQDKNAAAVALTSMEQAIDKGLKSISLHSITRKPRRKKGAKSEKYKAFRRKKEYNNLIDECYLLIGKAKFYKGENDQAEKIFKHLKRNYKNNKIIYETELWNIRNYIKLEKYILAKKLLDDIREKPDFPKKFNNFASKIDADILIKQADWPSAITALDMLIGNEGKKSQRAKYYFIQAQIYDKLNRKEKAKENYKKIIKLNTDYELLFRAELNIIHYTDYSDTAKIIGQLNDMLANRRNQNFKDQIYYILAELYAKNNDKEKAITNYKKVIRHYNGNERKRALAQLKLGNYAYEDRNYPETKLYYDRALPFLASNMPTLDTVKQRLQDISELNYYLEIIRHEEEILRAAKLSGDERTRWAARMQERVTKVNVQAVKPKPSATTPTGKHSWYFYNDAIKQRGKKFFETKWGNRKLEDHWRRSSKTTVSRSFTPQLDDVTASTSPSAIHRNKTRSIDEILATLPTTEEKVNLSHGRIKQAYYHIGLLYEQNFNDISKAIETYKMLQNKYTDNSSTAQSFYHLFMLYDKTGVLDTADYYKQLIVENYPLSEYAKYIKNPNLAKEVQIHEVAVEDLYQDIYNNFIQGNFADVKNACTKVLAHYPTTPLKSNLLFLKAISIGKTEDREKFKIALDKVLKAMPGQDIKSQTEYILGQLNSGIIPGDISYIDFSQKKTPKKISPPVVASKETQATTSTTPKPTKEILPKGKPKKKKQKIEKLTKLIADKVQALIKFIPVINENRAISATYTFEPNAKHYFILIVATKQVNVNNLWTLIYEHNTKYKVSKADFQRGQKMFIVKEFHNKQTATAYFKNIIRDDTIYEHLLQADYRNFIITEKNLQVLRKSKALGAYLTFYKNNYLKK